MNSGLPRAEQPRRDAQLHHGRPLAIDSQRGNNDGGKDLPHIMEVIDWVYKSFAAFDIRAMWVAGHSWGAIYATTFVCKPELASKIKGGVFSSGFGANPARADRLAVISTAAEMDIGPVIEQGQVPMSHGCGAAQMHMIGDNVETYWPNCRAGFAHANYFMLVKQHETFIDAPVVARIADLIESTRL